jgi:hypothetical protein
VLLGVGWQGTSYNASAPPPAQNLATGLIATEVNLFRFKKSKLDFDGILLPTLSDPGRVHFNSNACYYLKLVKNLSWNRSLYGNWDNRPPARLSGSDYGTAPDSVGRLVISSTPEEHLLLPYQTLLRAV